MKKILLTISMLAFTFADVHLYMCDSPATVDAAAGTVQFDVCYSTDVPIAGIQFTFDGGTSGFELAEGTGGATTDNGFTVSTSASGTVLGFAFDGSTVPVTEGAVLVQLSGTFTDASLTDVGPTMGAMDAFATSGGSGMVVSTQNSQWDGGSTLDADLPASYALSNNYPNPFNPSTRINYNVEIAGDVSLIIYDMTGRQVKELVNEYKTPLVGAQYSAAWDGTNDAGGIVSAGTYICRMISSDFISTNKMTFMK